MIWNIRSHWYNNTIIFQTLQENSKRYERIPSVTREYAQDSCACTRFLCMHNTLVHAQHSCACTGGARDQGQDPKKTAAPGRTRGCFVLGPGRVPWPLQCMHKSVAHAQECCACTRILRMHKNLVHAIESYFSIIVSYNNIIVSSFNNIRIWWHLIAIL